MEIRRVWAVYWSATGTTRAVVQALAISAAACLGLPVEVWDFTIPPQREKRMCFQSDDLVFFGTPTYAGRVPNVLLPYLREKLVGGGALAVAVTLFGNRDFDDALLELYQLLEQRSFLMVAAAAFVGEHAFSRCLAAGRPDGADLTLAADFGRRVAEKVQAAVALSSLEIRGQQPLRPYYTPRDRQGDSIDIRRVKPKTSGACNHCGLCARICPMGSIDQRDEGQVPGVCIKCCACEKNCPKGAKYFDDAGYLYHRAELEAGYVRRAEPEVFL